MKITILTTILSILFSTSMSCLANKPAGGYEIKVKVNNLKDDVSYLGYYFGDKRYIKDTVNVVNGTFTFGAMKSR